MRIDANDTLAGQPIIEVRNFLRCYQLSNWSEKAIENAFGVDSKRAKRIVSLLKKLGYIKPVQLPGRKVWNNTIKGNAFALASATKPISRVTAERKLKEFMDRVIVVKNYKYFLYKVTKVVVFGSYISKKKKINDIDISITLEPKEKNVNKQIRLNEERIIETIEDGRRFRNEGEKFLWPMLQVIKYLKSRSRSLSIHIDEPILARTKYKVIYIDK